MARGIAHIGVLKVIDQYKIPVEFISATSSGSVVGAAYAAGIKVRLIEEIGLKVKWGRIIRASFFRPGFISEKVIEELIVEHIGDKEFSDLKIPFSVVVADLTTGQPVVINQGKVAKAVAAASSFPGIFAPGEINRRPVVDGGIVDNLPVDAVNKMGANYVIASDVIPSGPIHDIPRDPLHVFSRALDIALHRMSISQRKRANVLIEPRYKEYVWPYDLHQAKLLISAGEEAAHLTLGHLRRV